MLEEYDDDAWHGFCVTTAQDDSLSCQDICNLPKALTQLPVSPFP